MNKIEQTEEEFLASYDASRYPKPSVTVDVLIIAENKILLVKRGNHPYKNHWALPGGFINMDEDLPQAASRELAEETGIKIDTLELIGVYGDVGRDPRDRIIGVAFGIVLPQEVESCAADDAKDSQWFTYKLTGTEQKAVLELRHEEICLKSSLTLAKTPVNGRWKVKELLESQLAFDHGKIIADGLLSFGKGDELVCAETI